MKKLILLISLVVASVGSAQAQKNPYREAKRAEQQAQNAAYEAKLTTAIKNKNFRYVATEIVYGQNFNLQNINLNQLYWVNVQPGYLSVNLPQYGPNSFNGQPALLRRLEFEADSYTYNIEPIRNGGWTVTINATDPGNINSYNFVIRTTPSGNWCYLALSTAFLGAVTFNGTVYPQ